jgi:DDE family transposase
LRELLHEQTAGNPAGPQKWVRQSVRHLSEALRRRGHDVCPNTVRALLHELDYSLKANRKRFTGPAHPDRDRQFEYIAGQRRLFNILGSPVISVDAKKKELIGNFQNAGRVWCRRAAEVKAHDFRDDTVTRVVPYGIYLPRLDRGYVCVGLSAETGEFAADAIARWWREDGRWFYPEADELLILADAGGGNGCRRRLWQQQIQEKLADRWGLRVTVCHYPRGASKWNPVEHRLFSRISTNWAGQPLRSLSILLAYLRGTKTASGTTVRAVVLERPYPEGLKVSDEEMATLRLAKHPVCPDWNYTIKPRWSYY